MFSKSFRSSTKGLNGAFRHQMRQMRYMVGIDGTDFGYRALTRTLSRAHTNDEIIAIHIPQELVMYNFDVLQVSYSHFILILTFEVSFYMSFIYSINGIKHLNFIQKLKKKVLME